MRSQSVKAARAACMVCLLAWTLSAAPFEPLVQVVKIDGKCQVKIPGSHALADAELNKAYPFGTVLVTDSKSTAVLRFSEGNTLQMQPGTTLALRENTLVPGKANEKTVILDVGAVQLKLDPKFKETNSLLVRTPVGAADLLGGEFAIETRSEPELHVSVFKCIEGQLSLGGPNYRIPLLDKGDALSVATHKDESFTRLEDQAGDIVFEFKDPDGAPKQLKGKQGTVVKIWRRLSESGKMMIVSVLLTHEGQLQEVLTYSEDVVKAPVEKIDTGTGEAGKGSVPSDWPMMDVTPTTTTTTSTTFPSPTPVGRM